MRLRALFRHTLVLGFYPPGGAVMAPKSKTCRPADAKFDHSLGCAFLDHVRGRDADDAEQSAIAAALDNVRLREASL